MSHQPAPQLFTFEPLGRQHDRAAFCCGHASLDRYLKQQASQDARKNIAAPFVLLEPGSKVVKGYYTLSMTAIELDRLPEAIAQTLPKYPLVPATLLGRLAVDQNLHGRGTGRLLLADSLKRSLQSEIAWLAVIVDAIDDQARAFYEHYGFIPLPGQPRKLFMLKKTIERAFGCV